MKGGEQMWAGYVGHVLIYVRELKRSSVTSSNPDGRRALRYPRCPEQRYPERTESNSPVFET